MKRGVGEWNNVDWTVSWLISGRVVELNTLLIWARFLL